MAMIDSTPGIPAPYRSEEDDMALDDDMTTPAGGPEPATPADRAEGTISEDDYLGRDGGADGGSDGGSDGGADTGAGSGADEGQGSGAGEDDPTTETDEDSRFA
jgi:hypothetical protein